MGLHPPIWLSPTLPLLPNLGQSAPVQPQSHVPLACGPVHCPCALPVCALPGYTARVHCLGSSYARGLGAGYALPVRAACAHCLCVQPVREACGSCLCARPVGAACARCMGVACARCMSARPGRGLCTLHGRYAWALPVHVAWALCLCALPVHVAWALPVHAAWALSTRSWHCAHDHQPMCASIECLMPQIRFCSFHCP